VVESKILNAQLSPGDEQTQAMRKILKYAGAKAYVVALLHVFIKKIGKDITDIT